MNGSTSNPMRVLALAACLLMTGCSTDTVGLRARCPEDETCLRTLRPTLQWDAFTADMLRTAKKDAPPVVTDITYELRLWHEGEDQIDLVYQVQDLREPMHEVAMPLLPGHRYRWSVRAWFALDGRRRATRWSLVDDENENDAVPNSGCTWFETPPSMQSDPAGAL